MNQDKIKELIDIAVSSDDVMHHLTDEEYSNYVLSLMVITIEIICNNRGKSTTKALVLDVVKKAGRKTLLKQRKTH